MKEVIDAVKAQGIKTNFILGGAVVNEAYAHSIGAAFAKDGVEAVKVMERLIKK
jgi:5-methyltetrahydrofolate--homocysteine methyltransferase